MIKAHSFHIPVMGIGFTVDTPLKVAQYGMDSVISLVDDILLEKLRKMYSEKYGMAYNAIANTSVDYRARRITAYLNLIGELADEKFKAVKALQAKHRSDFWAYIKMLPEQSKLKTDFRALTAKGIHLSEVKKWASKALVMGSIDVNIMTKVDKTNYNKTEKLESIYNDAHAALRGFANSKLNASVVFSAGMNPRLYAYLATFDAFFPNTAGVIKKRIILKVSDYRSAYVQGKFLAKKGLWVSEYRIESGLNCGGHAFATEGLLLGAVLQEFKANRERLKTEVLTILCAALRAQGRVVPQNELSFKVSAQGGVGTAAEHNFLLKYYGLSSIGWGSPFLLVPEATAVDSDTLLKLKKAKEEDLYLSNISPLGIPFNSLRNNTKDIEKQRLIAKNRPGSACPKKFVALNNEFKATGLCTASREYQHLKLKALETENLEPILHKEKFKEITQKSCTCVGLGTSALLKYDLDTRVEGKGVSVCPGPNMAYFSKEMSLEGITDHIYDRANVISRTDRPHLFVKELYMYMDYLKQRLHQVKTKYSKKEESYLNTFMHNMRAGILYYKDLFLKVSWASPEFEKSQMDALHEQDLLLQQFQVDFKNYNAIH
jgi:hypothetical protein